MIKKQPIITSFFVSLNVSFCLSYHSAVPTYLDLVHKTFHNVATVPAVTVKIPKRDKILDKVIFIPSFLFTIII